VTTTPIYTEAEKFAPDELLKYEPVGEAPKKFLNSFENELKNIIERAKTREGYIDVLIVEGFYGMGKTLLARRALLFAFRTHFQVLPIYIPLRKLARTPVDELRKVAEELDLKFNELTPLTVSLVKWYRDGREFLGEYGWNLGKTVDGVEKERVTALKSVLSENPETLVDLLKAVNESGFVPVMAVDELEALILRDTRREPLISGGDKPERGLTKLLTRDVFNNMYNLLNSREASGLLIITSAVKMNEEWIRIALREYAIYREPVLAGLLTDIGVEDRELTRISSLDPEQALGEVETVTKKYIGRFPLSNPAVRQRLGNRVVELSYTAGDYEELAKRFGVNPVVPDILKYFAAIKLSIRTYLNILKSMRSLGVNQLDYNALARVFGARIEKCYDLDTQLKSEKVIPSHTKWLTRTCKLLEYGIVALPTDIIPTTEIQPGEELKKWYEDLVKNLCNVFEVRLQCTPWNYSAIRRIQDRMKSLQLNWGVVKYVVARGTGLYAIDEAFIRWILDDPYDLVGNVIDIREYVESIVRERKIERGAERATG